MWRRIKSYKVNVTIGDFRTRLFVSARSKKEARFLVLCQAEYVIYKITKEKKKASN